MDGSRCRHFLLFAEVIPMVNVDGVVHGNSRCTLAGVDPNRVWPASSARRRNKEKMEIMNSLHELRHDPNPILHPVIFALKNHLRSLSQVHQSCEKCQNPFEACPGLAAGSHSPHRQVHEFLHLLHCLQLLVTQQGGSSSSGSSSSVRGLEMFLDLHGHSAKPSA